MARWPEPVRPPLPVGQVTEDNIDEALRLTIRYLDDPESPAFDPAMFGFVCAARAALIQAGEILSLARIRTEMAREEGDEPERHMFMRIGEVYAAQKVAREVINALRQWVPEQRS